MRKLFGVVALVAMVAMLAMSAAQVNAKDMTWTGWITDSLCSGKQAMWTNKDCAIKCVKERGASYVFVNSQDKKVLKIQNQDAVTDERVGVEVKVTGNVTDDGSLHITKIEPTKM